MIESKNQIKTYFEFDDEPTETEIGNLIDSFAGLHRNDESNGFVGNVKITNKQHPMYGTVIADSTDFIDFLRKLFFPFDPASITINGDVVFELGTNNDITISGTIYVNSETILISADIIKPAAGGSSIYPITIPGTLPASIAFSHIDASQSASTSYRVKLIVERNTVQYTIYSPTKTVTGVIPYLYGGNVAKLNNTNIYDGVGISKSIILKQSQVTVYFDVVNNYLHFAWKKSYGMITQIVDNNGFDQSFGAAGSGESWEYTEGVVTAGIWSEEMYILTQGPTTVEGYFTFKW